MQGCSERLWPLPFSAGKNTTYKEYILDNCSLVISDWEKYQPRKDLKELTWFRLDTNIFNGETYFLIKNDGLIVFIFLLSIAAKENNPEISFSLDFAAEKIKIKKDVILSTIEKLESKQIVHKSVQIRADLSPTIHTDIQTIHNKQTIQTETFDFDSAYFLYPLKKGKTNGFKKLAKDIKNKEDVELLSKAIANYKKDLEINKTDSKYIKHFSTFCNEWRDWIDYAPTVSSFNKSKEQKVFDTAKDQIERIERGEL